MKVRSALLLCTALIMPVPAHADPVSAFFVAIGGGSATSAAAATAIGGLTAAAYSLGTFFTTALGSLLLSVGLNSAIAALSRPSAPTIADAQINTRLENSTRWVAGGTAAVGGAGGMFLEFDATGAFWYIIAHADAELTGDPEYILDGIPVELATTGTTDIAVDYVLNAENYALTGEIPFGDSGSTNASRVLVRSQTNPSENGIYITDVGAWTRAADMAAGSDIAYFVVSGPRLGPSAFPLPDAIQYWSVLDPIGVVGTADMDFSLGRNERRVGDVLTDAFCVRPDGTQYEGTGAKVPIWRIYTVTPNAANVAGALPADFTDAFPALPADFIGAGVTFSIIRGRPVKLETRQAAYKWRGIIGIGEPSVSLVGNFNRMYDPRNVAHNINNPSTWTASDGNPAIVWAWWRTYGRGRGKAMASINWTKVAEWADIFDTTVLDRSGEPVPLYRVGVAFPDNKRRAECEQDILAACDGYVAYDDDGNAYIVGGFYQAPTITLDGDRDVITSQTRSINDGETPLDGVICEYISPLHSWTKQPSAPWRNPLFWEDGREPNYQVISVLGCQDHNQAVRLAKAHGQRIGAAIKAAFETTPRGILMRHERAITLDVDAELTGVFEIATNVEESPDLTRFAFAVVPLGSDRWTLNAGEEGVPPVQPPALNIDNSLELPQNVVISAVPIATWGSAALRLEAKFDPPQRVDRIFIFRHTRTDTGLYEYMTTDMDELLAKSALVNDGQDYDVSWQTVTAGGRATDWSPPVTVTASVAPVAIETLADPGRLGRFAIVTGWRGGAPVTALGDGEWWREEVSGEIVTAARFLALFDSAEYQIDQAARGLSGVLSLTRADSATYIDGAGLLQTAAPNVPRIDHAMSAPALLIEPAATNRVIHSADFSNTVWTSFNHASRATGFVGPDGSTDATGLIESGATGARSLHQAVALSQDINTSSIFFAPLGAGAKRWLTVGIRGATNTANYAAARFDLETGDVTATSVVGSGFAVIDAYAVPLANGWYRGIVTTETPDSSATVRAMLSNSATIFVAGGQSSYAGDNTSGALIFGAQMEVGPMETSYVPTSASAVTRAADVAQMNGITATLDLSLTYGDGTDATITAQAVSPSYWPTLAQTRIRRIVGRT